ncbi:MAG: pyridoxal-phosphate dependent enzyme, partial [Sphingomonadales bacterium]
QFENESNPDMHSRTTAPEILADFEGEALDYWVTGFGTAGTLKGVGRVLKKARPDTKIIVCEPDNSQILGSGIAQKHNADGSPDGSHPNFRPHLMQGWSPDFVPKLAEDVVALELIDGFIPIAGTEALRLARELAQKEGIFVGISSGATFAGALRIAETAPPGTTILCMLPDTGERYLSTPLFEDIPADMSDEEVEISKSTPRFRFDRPSSPPPPAEKSGNGQEVSAEAAAFVSEQLSDPDQPVVMFAMEWCEFCWSVRKMFGNLEIPYTSVDLDSVAYQKDDWGGRIRQALNERTSMKTIPQIFVGGELIGGCTEVFDAFKEGRLQKMLGASGISLEKGVDVDPYSFLPDWLHPR